MSSILHHHHLTHCHKSLLRPVHRQSPSVYSRVLCSNITPPTPKLEVTLRQHPSQIVSEPTSIVEVVMKPPNHGGNVSISPRVRCASTGPPMPKLQVTPHQTIEPSQMVSVSTLIPKVTTKPSKPGDPSLKSTWAHRAWLAGGCTTLAISLAKCMAIAIISHTILQPALAALVGYCLADLGSGVVHWGLDNYENGSNQFLSEEIDAFQGHHRCPLTITKRQIANNLHSIARATTFTVLPINLVCNDPTILAFVCVFAGCVMFSQQFHAWAHGTKSKLPWLVVVLQDLGVLISRSQHSKHHHPPYNKGYCIVSGVWNDLLDRNKVFEAMEKLLFFRFGIRPRSWSETISLHDEEDAKLMY